MSPAGRLRPGVSAQSGARIRHVGQPYHPGGARTGRVYLQTSHYTGPPGRVTHLQVIYSGALGGGDGRAPSSPALGTLRGVWLGRGIRHPPGPSAGREPGARLSVRPGRAPRAYWFATPLGVAPGRVCGFASPPTRAYWRPRRHSWGGAPGDFRVARLRSTGHQALYSLRVIGAAWVSRVWLRPLGWPVHYPHRRRPPPPGTSGGGIC